MATRLLVGTASRWRAETAALVRSGARRDAAIDLPPEADVHRAEVLGFLEDLVSHPKVEWNRRIADSGYLVPHWPRPWGRDASPLEQLVADDEFRSARVRRPHLAVGGWALPTIIVHGDEAQQERFIAPTLRGELTWCQMFSEPEAGSDLASLTTRATRVDGGWNLNGQKIWTTSAHFAEWYWVGARTSADAPKHSGISLFLIPMNHPRLTVHGIATIGDEITNSVYLDNVFVSDDYVVGQVNRGFQYISEALDLERFTMFTYSPIQERLDVLCDYVRSQTRDGEPLRADPVVRRRIARLVTEAEVARVLGLRFVAK